MPLTLNHVIFKAIAPKALRDAFDRDNGGSDLPPSNRFDGQARDQIAQYVFDTRMITFGILIGMLILLWTPFLIWKRIVSNCSVSYTASSRVAQTGCGFVGVHACKCPDDPLGR